MDGQLEEGQQHRSILLTIFLLAALFVTSIGMNSAVAQNDPPESTPDGLQLIPSSEFAIAYFRPDADFSGYDKLIIEEPEVAFRSDWRSRHRNATINDMARIRRELAELFRDVFIEEFQDKGSYQVVDEAGEDVLLIRPGIGDLDVSDPILATDRLYRSPPTSGTAATLVLELSDSVSGEVLARVFDRQQARAAENSGPATQLSNTRDATGIFAGWAKILRDRLGEVHDN